MSQYLGEGVIVVGMKVKEVKQSQWEGCVKDGQDEGIPGVVACGRAGCVGGRGGYLQVDTQLKCGG